MKWRCTGLFLFILPTIFFGSACLADIRDTPHNFTRTDKGKRAGDKEVCAFCHTPAIAIGEGTKPVAAPVWQPSVGADLVFTIYDDIGRLGAGKPSVGSQSIACLSCHDTNQAMSVSKTALDHPFGVPYRGYVKANPGVAALPTQRQSNVEVPFVAAKALVDYDGFRDASSGTVEGRTVWWVSHSGITARRGKRDLPLYVRSEEGSMEPGVPFIECSSCHDPHSVNTTFLRVENDTSSLCMTCHSK